MAKTSITDMPHEPQNGKKDEDTFEKKFYETARTNKHIILHKYANEL